MQKRRTNGYKDRHERNPSWKSKKCPRCGRPMTVTRLTKRWVCKRCNKLYKR